MNAFKIGSVSGIRLQVHWTFGLLIAWVLLSAYAAGGGGVQAAATVGFVLALFGCVLLHELGHAMAARRYGIQTRDITLLPIGGVARLERMPREPLQELVVALAGPAVNVVIAGLLLLVLLATGSLPTVDSLASGESSFLARLMFVNVALVIFNLIPAFPMDGGRVLRAVLGMFTSYVGATRIAAAVGQVCAIGFAFLGLSNPILLLIAAFVFFAAAAEARQVALQERLAGVPVRDGMLRQFLVVPANAPLRELADRMLDNNQREFPVVDDGAYVGMLQRDAVLSASRRADATARDAMQSNVEPVDESTALTTVLSQGQERGELHAMPVTSEGHLVGLLDFGQMLELVQARSQIRRVDPPADAAGNHSPQSAAIWSGDPRESR